MRAEHMPDEGLTCRIHKELSGLTLENNPIRKWKKTQTFHLPESIYRWQMAREKMLNIISH